MRHELSEVQFAKFGQVSRPRRRGQPSEGAGTERAGGAGLGNSLLKEEGPHTCGTGARPTLSWGAAAPVSQPLPSTPPDLSGRCRPNGPPAGAPALGRAGHDGQCGRGAPLGPAEARGAGSGARPAGPPPLPPAAGAGAWPRLSPPAPRSPPPGALEARRRRSGRWSPARGGGAGRKLGAAAAARAARGRVAVSRRGGRGAARGRRAAAGRGAGSWAGARRGAGGRGPGARGRGRGAARWTREHAGRAGRRAAVALASPRFLVAFRCLITF